VQSIVMSMLSVYLFIHITPKPHCQNFTKFLFMLSMILAQTSGGIVTLCTSDFVDDIIFSHNGAMACHDYS